MTKSFCHWVETEKGINMGAYYKSFHPPKEDIPIIVLQPEQLNFLIYNEAFDAKLPRYLRNTKDFFVFGCTVGLRVSDIKALKKSNLEGAASHMTSLCLSENVAEKARLIPWEKVWISSEPTSNAMIGHFYEEKEH